MIYWIAYMYFSKNSVHCTRTIPSNGECSQTTPQHPSAPTTNWEASIYNSSRRNLPTKSLHASFHLIWQWCINAVPARVCHTSGLPRSCFFLLRGASAQLGWCHLSPCHKVHPSTPDTSSVQSYPENLCWLNLQQMLMISILWYQMSLFLSGFLCETIFSS